MLSVGARFTGGRSHNLEIYVLVLVFLNYNLFNTISKFQGPTENTELKIYRCYSSGSIFNFYQKTTIKIINILILYLFWKR